MIAINNRHQASSPFYPTSTRSGCYCNGTLRRAGGGGNRVGDGLGDSASGYDWRDRAASRCGVAV